MASGTYRLFGSELSPYSVKLRSYLRFKGIAHEWIPRGPANAAEFQKHAKLPLIPLLVTPDGEGLQDSTPVIERLEAATPEPSIHPDDPALRFLSQLVEEYGDEWLNKPMFHYRWSVAADCESAAGRIARQMLGPEAPEAKVAEAAKAVAQRMVPRLGFVGSNAATKDTIEGSFRRVLDILEVHLQSRRYLFGDRPALGDFGVWAQIYEAWTDPTGRALIDELYPTVWRWIERMLSPTIEGGWESWDALKWGLGRLLETEVGPLFLPWSAANAAALAAGAETMSVDLDGRPFTQQPQKYHARSLAEIRRKYAAAKDAPGLAAILDAGGCRRLLEA
ncbi:MAG: glutathione S-transferase family protein [Rhodospirillales bacterium]|nr:glutathione S-transferase family protein [Rhodospirillales bacterium]